MYFSRFKYLICAVLLLLAIGLGGYFLIPKFKNTKNNNQKIALVNLSALDSDSDGLSDKKELELGTNQYSADSDGDGYFDAEEVKSGHDPLKIESRNLLDDDGDSLSNEDEKKYGTNIKNSDSDSDGYGDGAEIAYGHNPLKPDFSFIDKLIPENEEAQKLKDLQPMLEGVAGANTTEELEEKVNVIADKTCPFCEKSYSKISINTGELNDSDFNISKSAATKSNVQSYIYAIAKIAIKSLPFSLLEPSGVEDYITGFDPFNTKLVNENSRALSSAISSLKTIEVPNDKDAIAWHKKFFSFLTSINDMLGQWKSGQTDLGQAAGIFKNIQGMAMFALSDLSPGFENLAKKYGVELPKTEKLYSDLSQ